MPSIRAIGPASAVGTSTRKPGPFRGNLQPSALWDVETNKRRISMRRLFVALSIFLVATIAAASERKVHRTAQLDPAGSLSIDTHNGSITVTTWNQPTVDVVARIVPTEFGR